MGGLKAYPMVVGGGGGGMDNKAVTAKALESDCGFKSRIQLSGDLSCKQAA